MITKEDLEGVTEKQIKEVESMLFPKINTLPHFIKNRMRPCKREY